VGKVFFFAFTAALNPALLGATTVMLLLPNPKRLLIGYLCGALMTSITLGLLIVFHFEDSGVVDTAENTLSPAADFALGGILLAVAYVLVTGRDREWSERRKERKAEKESKTEKEPSGPPRWQRFLSGGKARDAFIVGALLTLPGGSYLAGLANLATQDVSTTATVLTVLAFNAIMLILLEVPTLGYVLAPDTTPARVDRFKAGISRHGRSAGMWGATVIGGLLVVRGAIELLS
jgi:hypothetical protein